MSRRPSNADINLACELIDEAVRLLQPRDTEAERRARIGRDVAAVLAETPNASKNAVARQVRGERRLVLEAVSRLRPSTDAVLAPPYRKPEGEVHDD